MRVFLSFLPAIACAGLMFACIRMMSGGRHRDDGHGESQRREVEGLRAEIEELRAQLDLDPPKSDIEAKGS